MPNRRSKKRRASRIRVKFWAPGQPDKAAVGYTTNVSSSGCFILTERPAPIASRLQMEFRSAETAFVCEGLVARSIKSPHELRQVKPSGMGVRFLAIEELLGGMTSFNSRANDSTSAASYLEGSPKKLRSTPSPAAINPASKQANTPPEDDSGRSQQVARNHPAAAPRRVNPGDHPTPPSSEPVAAFRIAPTSIADLDRVYRSELMCGHLVVPAKKSYPPGSRVRIEIALPHTDQTVELFSHVQRPPRRGAPTRSCSAESAGLRLALESSSSALKAIDSFLTNNG